LPYVTHKCDEAFGSSGFPDGFTGRERHDRQLLTCRPDTVYILEYANETSTGSETGTPKGFSVILPLKSAVAKKYLEGQVDQFRLTESDLLITTEMTALVEAPALYVKALFTEADHQTRAASVVPRLRMVAKHVARILGDYRGSDFTLIAEGTTEEGRAIMQRYGFHHNGASSPSGHGLYRFDSDGQLNKFGRCFVKEVNRARNGHRAAA
jgi:hypothetical protein